MSPRTARPAGGRLRPSHSGLLRAAAGRVMFRLHRWLGFLHAALTRLAEFVAKSRVRIAVPKDKPARRFVSNHHQAALAAPVTPAKLQPPPAVLNLLKLPGAGKRFDLPGT